MPNYAQLTPLILVDDQALMLFLNFIMTPGTSWWMGKFRVGVD